MPDKEEAGGAAGDAGAAGAAGAVSAALSASRGVRSSKSRKTGEGRADKGGSHKKGSEVWYYISRDGRDFGGKLLHYSLVTGAAALKVRCARLLL